MRLCPSVEGSASPLITHRIGPDVCLARQAANFHKCHRCIFRGQAADWVPDDPEPGMIKLQTADAPTRPDVEKVVIPRPGTEALPSIAANG